MSALVLRTRLVSGILALLLAAPPLHAETEAKVDVAASSQGWVVVREAHDEKEARLSYSYQGKAPTRVQGVRDGSRWKFRIDEQVPPTAQVTLEFELLRPATKVDADASLTAATQQIAGSLTAAFPQASASARTANGVSLPLLHASLGALVREQIANVINTTKLASYELDGRPASDVLLENLGFKQLGPKVWEPTSKTFEILGKNWGSQARRLDSLTTTITQQDKNLHPCAGDSQALQGSDAKAARLQAEIGCLKVFSEKVREALALLNDARDRTTLTKAVQSHATKLEGLGAPGQAAPAVFAAPQALKGEVGEGLAADVAASLQELADALGKAAIAKPTDAGKFATARDEAGKAFAAAQYVAALEAEPALRAALDKEIEDDIKAAVLSKFQAALFVERLVTQDYASEVFVVDKPKPRFFVSTGVVAAAFNDDWQLAVPIIASICVTSAGCETKGAGSGGNQGNYFSLDLGVKTVRIGGEDRREGPPSFLLGFGATPFYATHFSLGLNVFPNRQSDTPRANAAVYLAVTLDTIDGADILGSLGVGKPEVKPVTGTTK